MTKEEIINLYIEKLSFQETIYQLSRFGHRIECSMNKFCKNMERKINEIDFKLNQNPALTASVILEYRETIKNYNDEKQKNRPSNQNVIK